MVNKKLFSIILATLVTVGIVGGASVAFAQTTVVTTQKTTIVTTAESQPQTFSDLVKALNATNLTATLNDTTKNFTVFAPNNAAFDALGNVTLNDLLTNNTTRLSTILLRSRRHGQSKPHDKRECYNARRRHDFVDTDDTASHSATRQQH